MKRLRHAIAASAMAWLAVALQACGAMNAPHASAGGAKGKADNTSGVLCDYAHSAFNSTPSVNAISSARWTCDGEKRTLTANGLPDHPTGVFPNPENPGTIAMQRIQESLPLLPVATGAVTHKGGPRVLTGYLLNGIKIDPGTAGTCNDAGSHYATDTFPYLQRCMKGAI